MNPTDARSRAAFSPEKMKKENLFDSPRMFLDVHGLLPGQAQKVHVHDDADKVVHCLAGEGVVTIGDAEHPIRPGEVTVFPAGLAHGVRNDGAEKLVLLVMMTRPA
ncbi:MAG: cupin domain-containing protein [Planctomycetota bacterium JB042]